VIYLSEWNSSRLWETWTNPWTNGVITSPTLYNDSTTTGASLTTTQAMYASVTQPAIGVPAGQDPNQPATYNYVVIWKRCELSAVHCILTTGNISLSWLNTVTPAPTIVAGWAGDRVILRSGTTPSATSQTPYTYYAVNLNASNGAVGSMLWSKTLQPPAGNLTVSYSGSSKQ